MGGVLDGEVEVVQASQELVAAEALADQGVDDLLDLGGDDVAAGEVGVVENLAEEALGQEVLHQHLVDGLAADVGVERLSAEREEVVEGGLEFRVRLVGVDDPLDQPLGQVRHVLLESSTALLEVLDVGLGVGVRIVEQVGELGGRSGRLGRLRGRSGTGRLAGVLEDGVAERVALGDLQDLGVEVVVGVLGFPVAAG